MTAMVVVIGMVVVIRVIVVIIVVVMIRVIVVIIVVVMIRVIVVIIVVIMIRMIVVIIVVVMIRMIVVIIVVVMIRVIIVIVVAVVVMNVNLSIKMFRFTPDHRWTNCSLNRQAATIAEAPFEDATKQPVDGVVSRVALEVRLKTTMPLDRDQGSEVELSCFQLFTTSTMHAMGQRRTHRDQGEQTASQQQKTETNHGRQHGKGNQINQKRKAIDVSLLDGCPALGDLCSSPLVAGTALPFHHSADVDRSRRNSRFTGCHTLRIKRLGRNGQCRAAADPLQTFTGGQGAGKDGFCA